MINVERKTYYALDVAKFISAFLVVCIHTGPLLDVDATGNFILVQILARLAVPFFFVASGFLFFRKLDFKREYNDYENKAICGGSVKSISSGPFCICPLPICC